ncbi:MAG: DoxX family protein [Actinobacteria bacterium]|nr:DoxX family protein [Actinomycetota bacterium]
MKTWGLDAVEWFAVLRIGLGLWWLESVRHKNLEAWLKRNAGINWAASVAEGHRWAWVGKSFESTVKPHPKLFTWIVLLAEFALGVGITFGVLTPVALAGGIVLNLIYLLLMIHEFSEQGQNGMMIVMGAVCLGAQAWQKWSVDAWLGLFGT